MFTWNPSRTIRTNKAKTSDSKSPSKYIQRLTLPKPRKRSSSSRRLHLLKETCGSRSSGNSHCSSLGATSRLSHSSTTTYPSQKKLLQAKVQKRGRRDSNERHPCKRSDQKSNPRKRFHLLPSSPILTRLANKQTLPNYIHHFQPIAPVPSLGIHTKMLRSASSSARWIPPSPMVTKVLPRLAQVCRRLATSTSPRHLHRGFHPTPSVLLFLLFSPQI